MEKTRLGRLGSRQLLEPNLHHSRQVDCIDLFLSAQGVPFSVLTAPEYERLSVSD